MSDNPTAGWTWINDNADRFERAWNTGARPRIEDYLAEADTQLRDALLEELLRVEIELRRSAGEEPTAREYRQRFPEQAAVVDAVFAPVASAAPGAGPSTAPNGGTPDAEPAHDPGTRVRYFGDYELLRELGRGGMGVVYKAHQISLNRLVALKMIRSAVLAGEGGRRRFQNEAEAVAALDHPHIVPILEVGCHEGQRYFSMKLIGGRSLDQKLADYTRDPKAAARLVKTAAEAVHHAHQRGILHRDLKPSNIVMDDRGEPFVTDFGLAKRVEGDSELTHSGAILGTPAYMAPEQASGRRGAVTTASDVYGLGAILYALLTGRAPFRGDSVEETLAQVRESVPTPPSKINPRSARDLEVICLKCLEKDPARRYSSAQALGEDLARHLAGEPIRARPVGAAQRAWMWCLRNRGISALGVLLAVSMIVGTTFSLAFAVRAKDQSKRAIDAAGAATREAIRAGQEALRANEQTELAEKRLYDVRMNLVQRHWEDYDQELFRKGLDELLPIRSDSADRRGFEWFYWQRRITLGHLTLKGHTNAVASVAFSPDGHTLASGSHDGTVRLWNTSTGVEIATLQGRGCVAFSPDGRTLAAVSADGNVNLWDVATGRTAVTLQGHKHGVSSLAFSPDGKRLASGGRDSTVKLWDTTTGQRVRTLEKTGIDSCVAFSPDGNTIAIGSGSEPFGHSWTVTLWDVAAAREIRTLESHRDPLWCVAFSPDGKTVAAAGSRVTLWDAASGRQIRTLYERGDGVTSVAFSLDGKRLASANWDRTVRLWDLETGQEAMVFRGHSRPILSVAFGPDGKRIASGGWDTTVRVWNTATGQEASTLERYTSHVSDLAFTPDGQQLASGGGDSMKKVVKLWDATTGREARSLNLTGVVASVAFGPDGNRVAFGRFNGTVALWDAKTGREVLTLEGHREPVRSVAFSPDGKQLASASRDHTIRVWYAATGQNVQTLDHSDSILCVALRADSPQLASASSNGIVRVWEIPTGKLVRTLKGHSREVRCVTFSADGRWLATASDDRTVRVWNVASGQESLVLNGHTGTVWKVAFSPDGERIASASSDHTVKLWDTATGLETLTLKGHSREVLSVTFSPDSRWLASGSLDGIVKLWDARPLDGDQAREARGPYVGHH
jgi:WD40 repeat protein